MAYSATNSEKKATPEYLGRKGDGVMSDEDFRAVVSNALSQSANYVETELSPDRSRATDYYLGKPFGNEEEGRSQAILTEVRDAVDGMVPSIMRVIHGPEHVVEFAPNTADKVEEAAQRTDYTRYVYEQDNKGFFVTLAGVKDGLIRKLGVFKWWWDDTQDTKSFRQEHITKADMQLLAAQDGVEIVEARALKLSKEERTAYAQAVAQYEQLTAQMRSQPAQPLPPPPEKPEFYDVEFTRTDTMGRARVDCVPPEEFLINRGARSIKDAKIVGHRTKLSRGQLLAMGVKASDLDEYGTTGSDDALVTNMEELARRRTGPVGTFGGSTWAQDPDLGVANQNILYTEALVRVDKDGDGIPELRHVCCIGADYIPIQDYPADDSLGFAVFSPYPEPHALLGGSVADRTMDMQRINSAMLRGALDSLAASIHPATVYLEGQASVADIMNTAIGRPMRERVAGAIRILEMPFVGKEVLPMLGFTQEVIERRTGRNKGAAGLDADALQSTGKEAVGAVLTGSQEQIELIVRVLAETLKDVFTGVGKLLKSHQQQARMVRLRGAWTNVDPRTWDDEMDVTVNVALGTTFTDKKIATLMAVAQDQETWITNLGMDNPMVSLPMLRNTRAKILKLQGLPDVDSYYKPIPMDWQPPPQPAPPPPPEVLALQQEKEMNQLKTIKELAIKQDELALKTQQAQFDQEFRLRELATNAELERYKIEATTHASLTTAQLNANIAQEEAEARLTIDAHDQLHDQTLERERHDHELDMEQQNAAAERQAMLTQGSDSGE